MQCSSHQAHSHSLINIAITRRYFSIIQFLVITVGVTIYSDDIIDETIDLLFFYANCGLSNEFIFLLSSNNNPHTLSFTDKNGDTLLQKAISNFDKEIVESLLQHDANVNDSLFNTHGTYLQQAIRHQDEKIAKLLINKGADTNAITDADGETPLQLAIQYDKIEIIRLLLENHADVHASTDALKKTPLQLACYFARPDIARLLLGDNTDSALMKTLIPEAIKNPIELKRLSLDIQADYISTLKLLLERGLDANVSLGNPNDTLLRRAVQSENEKIVELLLQYDANANAPMDASSDTLLQQAIQSNNETIIELLLDHGDNVAPDTVELPLEQAIKKAANIKIIKLLISKSANINASTNAERTTPLQLAMKVAYQENIITLFPETFTTSLETVELLINSGANTNHLTGTTMKSPLELAIDACDYSIVELLLQNNANVNDSTSVPEVSPIQQALQLAVRSNNNGIVYSLFKYHADVNAVPKGTDSPLHIAIIRNKSIEMARLLITHGAANVNAKQNGSPNFLQHAIQNDNVKMVEFLIANGADVDAVSDTIDTSPFQIAMRNNNHAIIKLLIDKHPDVNASDNVIMYPPLQLAIRNIAKRDRSNQGNRNIIQRLIENGANINHSTGTSIKDPLKVAIDLRDIATTKLLIDNGADTNAVSDGHATPLQLAVKHHNIKMAELLIIHDADVNASTEKFDIAPLQMSIVRNHIKMIELLLRKGADINAPANLDTSKRSVLELAREKPLQPESKIVLNHAEKSKAAPT